MSTSNDDSAATFVALKTLLYSVCDNLNIGNLVTFGQNSDGNDIICAYHFKNLRSDAEFFERFIIENRQMQ